MAELEKELETYRAQLPALLAQEGNFVVISGDSVLGTFAEYEDAIKVGYEKMGLGSFMVKKIESVEVPHFAAPNFAV